MNEQIKQLAEQAGLYDFVFEAMGIGEEFEKFAELIVQECIHTVESHGGMGGAVAGDKIRKQFGVKS